MKKLLSISIDRQIFVEGSAVRERMKSYAKDWDEMHIIVATTGKQFREASVAPNVWVYPTRSLAKALYPLTAARLGRFIVERRGITEITCQDPFFTAIAGVRLKRETGVPLELQVHTDIGSPNYAFTLANRLRKALALSYLPQADHIRVVSGRIRDYLVSGLGIDPSKIEVRPIAVDADAIRRAPVDPAADLRKKYPRFSRIVLVASRLEPEKGVKLAVMAWKEVASRIPGAGLVIVGAGSELGKLRKLVRHEGISNSVAFEPWASRTTLFSYYKTADAFANPSLFEGYGMALAEAQAAGCTIVSTDVGIAREAGALIAGHDAASFADRLIEALGGVID